MADHGDGNSGSDLGGFGHAESIEPGVLDDKIEKQDESEDDLPMLGDPEGLVGAHDERDES
jgi:hypothetical protein